MPSDNRQRRDGTAKRVQLTSGDHRGPNDKRKGRGKNRDRTMPLTRAQKKNVVKRDWQALFQRLREVKQRDADRRRTD